MSLPSTCDAASRARARSSARSWSRRSCSNGSAPRPSVRVTRLGEDARAIAEHRQLTIDELHRQLRGELDWIVIKALEKDPAKLKTLQDGAMRGIAKLPLLTACDQEGAWGVMVPHSSTGPGNMALGAAPVEQTQEMYSVFSRELSSVGVFVDLAPASDVSPRFRTRVLSRSPGERATSSIGRASDF